MSEVWTTVRPTEPGAYWWRNKDCHFKQQLCMVKYPGGLSDRLFAYFMDGERYPLEEMIYGEWAGPIPEPKEAT